jgi:hypothetical protein
MVFAGEIIMVSWLFECWKTHTYQLEHPDGHNGLCGEFELENKECAERNSAADFSIYNGEHQKKGKTYEVIKYPHTSISSHSWPKIVLKFIPMTNVSSAAMRLKVPA